MYVSICIYVCMYICMYIYIYVQLTDVETRILQPRVVHLTPPHIFTCRCPHRCARRSRGRGRSYSARSPDRPGAKRRKWGLLTGMMINSC